MLGLLLLLLLPATSRLLEEIGSSVRSHAVAASTTAVRWAHFCRSIHGGTRTGHAQRVGSRGRGNPDSIRVVLCSALNPIPRGQEGIESLDKRRVSVEQS